ncbi:hypothetical protein [Segnochrobactrum spirostomi]|nr:hypothetical protein [Segnochrobactrum spirostomi]
MATGDGLIARLTPRHGAVPLDVFAAIVAAARCHGNGTLEVTRRASLQVRGLTPASAPRFAADIEASGFDEAGRPAILIDPLAGRDPAARRDPRPLAEALRTAIAASGLGPRLAPKLTLVLDGGGRFGFPDVAADLRFVAVTDGRWRLFLGGTAAEAVPAGDVADTDIVPLTLAILSLLANLGPRTRVATALKNGGLKLPLSDAFVSQAADPEGAALAFSPRGEGGPKGRMRGRTHTRRMQCRTPHPSPLPGGARG